MLLEIGLALGLTLTTATAEFRPLPEYRFHPRPAFLQRLEAGAKPEGPKWAPNRMKILQFHRKGRWVVRFGPSPVDKSFFLPIEKVEL